MEEMYKEVNKSCGIDYICYKNENSELHNINDEPAIIWKDGLKHWYKNGKIHRTKGPAIICTDGRECWFYEGEEITDKVNQLMEEGKISFDWRNWTEEDEFLFVLLVS